MPGPGDLRDVADETQGREAVRMLLDAGADINATSQAGNRRSTSRRRTVVQYHQSELLGSRAPGSILKNELGTNAVGPGVGPSPRRRRVPAQLDGRSAAQVSAKE